MRTQTVDTYNLSKVVHHSKFVNQKNKNLSRYLKRPFTWLCFQNKYKMAVKKTYLLSVLNIVFLSYVIGSPCYEGWIHNEGSCYGFGDTTVSWIEATAFCSLFKSNLAEISSQSENDFIKLELRVRQANRAWIGGTDMFNDSNWQWIGSQNDLSAFSDWFQNDNDHNDIEDNCLVMWSSHSYQWVQDRCNHEYYFVCETKADGAIVG